MYFIYKPAILKNNKNGLAKKMISKMTLAKITLEKMALAKITLAKMTLAKKHIEASASSWYKKHY